MKVKVASAALGAGLSFGLAMGCSAPAGPSDDQGPQASPESAPAEQTRIADATLKLEGAFREQFVQGKIDRSALSKPIDEVVQAMPEAARPKVQEHIDQVLSRGAELAAQMTPEERAQVSAAPEKVSSAQHAIVSAWGWPNAAGWGGLGAFGFPGMYYSTGLSCTNYYRSYSINGWGTGYGGGGCTPFNPGTTGWYW
jgi:hypothetical protein